MPASDIWLTRMEESLRGELEQGDMPFLGLYSSHFDQKAREYFQEKVLGHTSQIQLFISGLKKWPAVFAAYVTVHVVEGYGRSGNSEVYPFVANALGTSEEALDQHWRVKLWRAYREACIRLGLSVVPKGSSSRPYVEEYLRQAGVPIKYLPQLVAKLESNSARLGVPDAGDPDTVSTWQDQLLGYLGSPISRTIPRAIETDETAYYTTTYLRVREYDSAGDCQNETESAIFEALSSASRARQTRAAEIPELQWRNGAMGIQIPSGENTEWRIRTELLGAHPSIDITVIAEDEQQFVPLPEGFPLKVNVSGPKSAFEYPAWEDDKDNKVLVVDRLGRIRARTSLGGDDIQLQPGTYTLITRWEPMEESVASTAVSYDPNIFESLVAIDPGEPLELHRGPASLTITGKSVPALEWSGLSKAGVLGREMLAGKGLSIIGTIPEEIASAAPDMFDVVIAAQDLDKQAVIPIKLDGNQSFRIELEDVLSTWPCGLFRLGVVIRRRDIPNRSFARMSGLIWNGLVSTDGFHFKCKSKEVLERTNIARDRCENVRFGESGLTFRDDEQRYFRIVFELSQSEFVAFTWLVPGLFLNLVEFNDQNLAERPLRKGTVIQVKPSSRSALKIYSTLEGIAKLGNYQKAISSSSVSGTQMYLAPVLEHISAENRTLQFVGETGVPIPLLEIVTPHQFTKVTTSRTADIYKVSLEVTDEIDEMSVEAIEMISGRRELLDLRVNVLESATGRPMQKIWAVSHETLSGGDGDKKRIDIHWAVSDWESGAYVFRIRANVAKRWGELVNARGDVFVGSMVITTATDDPLQSVEARATAELLDIFRRLTEFLLECYTEESWNDAKWIGIAWKHVAHHLDVTDLQVLIRLSILALRRAPAHSPGSWAPTSSVLSSRLDVFAQPAHVYARLPLGNLEGLGVLRSLGDFGPNDQENFSRDDLFAPLAILGFKNGSLVARREAKSLHAFSLQQFSRIGMFTGESERLRIRRREEWLPGPGLFLGAKHYWWAVNKLESNFVAGLVGNEHRRGNVLRLASRLRASAFWEDLPRCATIMTGERISLGLLHQNSIDKEVSQEEENIKALIDLISAVAFSCRVSARRNEFLDNFETLLKNAIGTTTESLQIYLGYALYIGIDLFLYYLLLWELVLSRDFDEVTGNV